MFCDHKNTFYAVECPFLRGSPPPPSKKESPAAAAKQLAFCGSVVLRFFGSRLLAQKSRAKQRARLAQGRGPGGGSEVAAENENGSHEYAKDSAHLLPSASALRFSSALSVCYGCAGVCVCVGLRHVLVCLLVCGCVHLSMYIYL